VRIQSPALPWNRLFYDGFIAGAAHYTQIGDDISRIGSFGPASALQAVGGLNVAPSLEAQRRGASPSKLRRFD